MAKIKYEAVQDRLVPEDWRVEGPDEDGSVYITIFSGPNPEARAIEYAALKNGTHPILKKSVPAAAPISKPTIVKMPPDDFMVTDQNGILRRIRPEFLRWTFDERRGTLTARPVPAIERFGEEKI